MKIDTTKLHTFWYENAIGDVFVSKDINGFSDTPEGYIYKNSQFPCTLTHNILKIVQKNEVDNCPHKKKHIRRVGGWIDGVEGHECKACYGTQTKYTHYQAPEWWPFPWFPKIRKPWPKEWKAEGSRTLLTGNTGWSEDLVLAMATSSLHECYTLSQAILIATTACEQCMNVLAHKYGLDWGYAPGSEDYKKAHTSCQFCKNDPDSKENK